MSSMGVTEESQNVNDVLASIRKLVSEETQARSNEALQLDQTKVVDDPLMLTPELKVAQSPSEAPLVLDVSAQTATPLMSAVGEEQTAPFQDEVALRALVSEMIREELQGELGNRITRNVRKLVRREIEIALKGGSS